MGKRLRFRGRDPVATHIRSKKKKVVRTFGGNIKHKLLSIEYINVFDPKTQKTSKVKVSGLETNPASRDFTRRKIVTKGAILSTELGEVRVTSRPGQVSVLNGVLLETSE